MIIKETAIIDLQSELASSKKRGWFSSLLELNQYFNLLLLRQVKSNRYLRLQFITGIRNTPCRFVCVCRTDMRRRAFESPDLALCFEYLHYGCWKFRKFFTAPQRSGIHFFWLGPLTLPKSRNFWESKK